MVRPPKRKPGSASHLRARAAKIEGCEKKKGSIHCSRAAISHAPISAIRIAS